VSAAALEGTRNTRVRDLFLTLLGLGVLVLALILIDANATTKFRQACALFAIWGVAAVSLNLINGTTGILSLGHHGFMLVGGYTTALLTLPEIRRQQIAESARSQMNDFTLGLSLSNGLSALGLDALTTPETLWLRFVLALFIGGLMAALFGLIVGIPSLRLRGDYLAIVTFGFGEIVRLLASTSLFGPFTNGSLGYTGVPSLLGRSLYWTFGILALTVFVMVKLKYSSYGRALQGVREDEVAAEAMGVNLAYHKVLAFALSAFFAGVAGGLYASWLSGARLDYFLFTLTFFFLVAISVGGTGSYTGVLIGTALVVFVRQYGDPLEQSYALPVWFGGLAALLLLVVLAAVLLRSVRRLRPRVPPLLYLLAGVGVLGLGFALLAPNLGLLEGQFQAFGMRAILLSVVLLAIMIFRPEGIMGRAEFSWAWLLRERRDRPSDEERAQDAWLTNPELNQDRTSALGNLREPNRRDQREGDV
jgi:branched-chain amino acid transport system permease protein